VSSCLEAPLIGSETLAVERPAAVPTQRVRSSRYETLDAWRGLACLLVVLYHSTVLININDNKLAFQNGIDSVSNEIIQCMAIGWVGVPLFFVISGYCITATALSTQRNGYPVHTYFIRRFRRIFPPYWCAIGLGIILVVFLDVMISGRLLSSEPWPQLRPWWLSLSQWIGNLTLTESWRHHLFGTQRAHFIGQSWTLCYEEQFYAVTGLLLLCTHRFFPAVLVTTVMVFAAQTSFSQMGIAIDGFFFDGQWYAFAAGIAVYFATQHATRIGWWCVAVALFMASAVALLTDSFFARGAAVAMPFALLLLMLHPFDGAIARRTAVRPLVFLGTICFSLYLVHETIVRAISRAALNQGLERPSIALLFVVPLCVAISLLTGWAFYLAVERRFMNVALKPAKVLALR
jgi:peptidoglycan/LPS O-acetylase OafA/YrhL